jgi:2',3'-cyclic-nucleotide 2'-phosphodiesterase (5'-nucleotidase family)
LIYGSFYEAYPFGNVAVRLNLTGAELRKVVAAQLRGRTLKVLISGIRVRATCAGTDLNVTLRGPTGRPIGDDEPVAVVVPDYLATGGDGILTPVMPPRGFAVPDDAPPVADALAEWLGRGGCLREDKLVDAKNPRWVYPGTLPVNCAR